MAGNIKGITIEIGGDTTKLDKALSEVNKNSRSLQAELKQVNSLLKLDPTNTELLKQKQDLLAQSITETKNKLDVLKEAEKQVQEQFERGEISEEQYRGLQREIAATEEKLESLTEEAKEFGSVTAQQLEQVGEKFKSVGDKISGAGEKLLPVTGTITAAGGAALAMATDFEDAMAKVSTIADTSQISIQDLEKQILELSDETGISATEIADNVYNAISAGQQTGDAVNFVSNATRLAKAGFTDSGAALDILTTAMNAYGMEAEEVTRVSDLLIQTQNLGKTTVGELSSSMGKVIPTAKANNVEIDQLCAGYAILTANGIATAESTTYMNSMLNELGKGGSKVDAVLREKTGKSFAELSAEGNSLSDVLSIINEAAAEDGKTFSDMWGSSEAAKAGIALLGDSADDFNGVLEQMQGATGATDEAFGKLDTTSSKMKIALNQMKNTIMQLGSVLLEMLQPIIASLVEKVQQFTEWFKNLNESQQQTIIKVAGVVAALGPALIIIGKVISAVGSIISVISKIGPVITAAKTAFAAFNAILAANPIILIVAAVVGLIAILVTLYNKCEWFRDAVNAIWEAIKTAFFAVFDGIKTFFTETLPNAFNFIIDFVKNNWQALLLFIVNPFAGAFKLLYDNCESFRNTIDNLIEKIKGFFAGLWTKIKEIFSGVGSWFKDIFTSAWTNIKNVFSNWGSFFSGLWDKIKNTFSKLGTSIADAIGGAVKSGINGVIGLIEGTINKAIGLINGAIGVINLIPGVSVSTIKDVSLPRLAKGGIIRNGSAIVAEAGPEIVEMVNGQTIVTPLSGTAKNRAIERNFGSGETGKTEIALKIQNFYNNRQQDIRELTEEILEIAEEIKGRDDKVYA